jgi:hypothetical protein
MNIYLQLLLITLVVVYIVDLSGWTATWLGWLSKFTARYGYPPVTELKPFSCSQCMTWWCCLLWGLCTGHFSLFLVAASAGFAFFSRTLCAMLIFISEAILKGVATLDRWIQR